ncbi:MAG: hypothetical protein RBR07_07675 [Arcobacteraceae bacterium]|nr:hypothetical protein [Arcobacteraceae bacterium]
MADITQLHEIALKYSQLSQASYHSGDIDLSGSYNIINIQNDTYEGYSATLFQGKDTNEFVYAIKGTNSWISDVPDDDGGLIFDKTPDQFDDMVNHFQSMIDQGYISKENPITVTGHSLGGLEAQILTTVFPEYIKETHTQNAPGALNLEIPSVMEYHGEYYRNYEVLSGGIVTGEKISKNLYDAYQKFNENKYFSEIADKIYNLKAKDGPSIIADFGEDIGNNNISIYGKWHFISDVVDDLKVYKALYSNYLSDEEGVPTDFYSWMNNQKDNFTILEGGYGDIVKLSLSNDNEIYLVKNQNGNYDKYELTPDSYNLNGEVTEYNVKIYDSQGNPTYSYDANEPFKLNLIQDGENLTLTKTPITLLSDEGFEYTQAPISIPLTQNQTISHVAQNTPYSSDELLEYNNLSQEEAKRLPVGYVVQIPKGVNNIEGGYGIIKEYESYDGSKIYYVPNQYGSKDVVTIDKEGNLIRNDVETNYDLMLLMRADEQSQEYVNKIDISKLEKYASSGYIMSDASFYEPNSQTISYEREDGSICQITYDTNNDLLIYGDPNNPQKITFTDEKGDYQVWERDKNGEFVRINSIDYSVVTNTAINQIGSLIISNNPDFSNIEKIAVSTSVATIADFVTYKGTDEFNSSQESVDNLKGAVVSFAVSSYFAKNDNISDLLGMDGTFLGDLADFTVSFTTSYSIGVLANNGFSFDALSNAFSSTTNSATGAITPSSYSTALTCRLINIF